MKTSTKTAPIPAPTPIRERRPRYEIPLELDPFADPQEHLEGPKRYILGTPFDPCDETTRRRERDRTRPRAR